MKKIQMVDLYGQYEKIKVDIDQSIQQVIEKSAFIKGQDVKLLEEELAAYYDSKNVIACANGTDALQLALMALELQPGDEIISPDFTFISTVEVSAVLGLKPVLIDVDPNTFIIDPEKTEKAITSRTKAIVPVHLFGQCADMERLLTISQKYKIPLIEDNAQAIGSVYTSKNNTQKKSGTLGTIGCTSFFPSKNLGCYGDGGAICTDHDDLAEKMRAMANHGMKVKYYNDFIGINSRLDTIQAAILRVKLKKLDEYIAARQKVADYYDHSFSMLEHITPPKRNMFSTHVFHQYTVLLDKSVDRNKLQKYLLDNGIPTMIYYPVPMHRQTAYQYLKLNDSDYPVTNDITTRVLSLPIHTEMDEEQLEYIASTLKKIL